MIPDICIYHGDCTDGFTAAWAIHKKFPGCEFVPGVYNKPAPDCTMKNVLIVDFSYKRPALLEMAAVAREVLILDHHESAEKELVELPANCSVVFDMARSGAMIAWEWAFPDRPAPVLVHFVQDRDLWLFKNAGTRAYHAVLASYDQDFATWDELAVDTEDQVILDTMLAEGQGALRAFTKDLLRVLKSTVYMEQFEGFMVPMANLPFTMASEGGNIMCKGQPFSVSFYERADGRRVYSLRSEKGGEQAQNVSEIAARYGGGGHANAAGFSINLQEAVYHAAQAEAAKAQLGGAAAALPSVSV